MLDVGLIGFGLAGRHFHAPVLGAVEGLRLAAIVQRTGDSAAQAYPNARIVRTLDGLLSIDSLRLIVIATPNQSHFPLAKRCLEAGRHVVVDKPFTTTVAEAVELLKLAKQCDLILAVYHNRRFDADFQALRKLASTGELGRIVRFENTYDRFRPLPKAGAWRETPGPGSGVLFDLAPHLIDQAFMLFGEPLAISADIRTERPGFSTDDAFDLLLHYPEGSRALLRATMLAPTPRPRFVVLAEKGSFVKRDFDPLETTLRQGQLPPANASWVLEKEENWGELTQVNGEASTASKVPSFGDWRDFYSNLRDAILGRAAPVVTPQQALNVMVALELALESQQKSASVPWRRIQF
jgi:scyllo-inositol 2-dehydrogenase (NADP+)